jgi:trans-aconitate methyltransferase
VVVEENKSRFAEPNNQERWISLAIMIIKLVRKAKASSAWMLNTIIEMLSGKVTFKYACIKIWSQLTLVGKRFTDGVNWSAYNGHYLEELKFTSKKNTLIIQKDKVSVIDGKLQLVDPKMKPLILSHQLLYETILDLKPREVLEVGCGAGDHLANLKSLIPEIKCNGVDLLQKQLDSLEIRHPNNDFELNTGDITSPNCVLPKVELVFTHAVLMHISEKNHRFAEAIENVFNAATKHIVLVENWTQHDFMSEALRFVGKNPEWRVYYGESDRDSRSRVMVISKERLRNQKILVDYNNLKFDETVINH